MLRLTMERNRKGWTKTELAKRARLHTAQVSQFELGRVRPYPRQLQRIAEALELREVDPQRLLEEVPYESLASA